MTAREGSVRARDFRNWNFRSKIKGILEPIPYVVSEIALIELGNHSALQTAA
jgi:hypothetical protein